MLRRVALVAVSAFAVVIAPNVPAMASVPAESAAALVKTTGIGGGLCLVIGASDLDTAKALAAQSTLYVQVLQPDAKIAARGGAEVAGQECLERERLGVRNAAFDPEHYGSRLFNLIVVENATALGRARLADLSRILVPNGFVALRNAPGTFAADAEALDMTVQAAGAYAAVYRNPATPVAWRLPLETKWQAGPRSQIANGYAGISAGGGRLFYLEQMERDEGDLKNSAAVLFARDAYNGRTLWTWEAPGGWSAYAGTAATSDGRLFVRTGNGKVLRLDGATGKVVSEVVSKVGRETRIRLLNDDLLYVGGEVYSTDTGKPLWKFPYFRYQPLPGTIIGENVYFCDGTTIHARRLATGVEVWKAPATDLPKAIGPGSLSRADNQLLVRMKGDAKEDLAVALLDSATGKVLWTYTWKVRIGGEPYFTIDNVKSATVDGKLLLYYRHNQPGRYADEVVATRLDLATGKPDFEDKVNKDAGDFHGCFPELDLGDYIAWYDLWVNKKTLESAPGGVPHPACFFGMSSAYGLGFNFPSRKSGPISAVGPADAMFEAAPGGKEVCRRFGNASSSADTGPSDWPVFRGSASGGNAVNAALGKDLLKAWETQISVRGADFGVMSSQRTGLSQAVLAYGLAVVSDIDGGRIVALNAATGREKWVYHVGSRVDFPPALYKGLCLLAARDGRVHCLDALTGQPVYLLPAAPRERLMGRREKIESRWPIDSDVLIANGVAYISGGAGNGLAFKPETGEIVETADAGLIALGQKTIPGGRDLRFSYDLLLKGNSIPRTNEDNAGGFGRGKFGRNLDARVMAFDDTLTVAYQFLPAGEGWANKGKLLLKGITTDPRTPAWTSEPIELVVDDIVLTPQFAYCVGHHQRVKKIPEIWVVSRDDGKVVNTIPVDGFPAFFGSSAAGDRLFIATREGNLLCYQKAR